MSTKDTAIRWSGRLVTPFRHITKGVADKKLDVNMEIQHASTLRRQP